MRAFLFQGRQYQVSSHEIINLKKYFKNIKSNKIAYYLPKDDNFDKNPYFQHIISNFGIVVPYLKQDAVLISISNLLVHDKSFEKENYRNTSSLKRFAIKNVVDEHDMNVLIRKYLSKNRIDNLITTSYVPLLFLKKDEILDSLYIQSRNETYIKFKIND